MKQYLTHALISFVIFCFGIFSVYNYFPYGIVDLNNDFVGSTITTINGSDTLKDSRSVINTNFTNLNSDKMEWSSWFATTSAPQITAMSALATIGTIISGIWHGTVIEALYGGTGWGSIKPYSILLGNGTSKLATTTAGTDGQILTYSSSSAPYWASPSVDTAIPYSWTGYHTFAHVGLNDATSSGLTMTATGSDFMSVMGKGYIDNTSAAYDFGQVASTTAGIGKLNITHSLGVTPRMVKLYYVAEDDEYEDRVSQGVGYATSTVAGGKCTFFYDTGSALVGNQDGNNILNIDGGVNRNIVADVTTINSTTITLTFTTFESSGGVYIQWEAYK